MVYRVEMHASKIVDVFFCFSSQALAAQHIV